MVKLPMLAQAVQVDRLSTMRNWRSSNCRQAARQLGAHTAATALIVFIAAPSPSHCQQGAMAHSSSFSTLELESSLRFMVFARRRATARFGDSQPAATRRLPHSHQATKIQVLSRALLFVGQRRNLHPKSDVPKGSRTTTWQAS